MPFPGPGAGPAGARARASRKRPPSHRATARSRPPEGRPAGSCQKPRSAVGRCRRGGPRGRTGGAPPCLKTHRAKALSSTASTDLRLKALRPSASCPLKQLRPTRAPARCRRDSSPRSASSARASGGEIVAASAKNAGALGRLLAAEPVAAVPVTGVGRGAGLGAPLDGKGCAGRSECARRGEVGRDGRPVPVEGRPGDVAPERERRWGSRRDRRSFRCGRCCR